MDYRIIDGQVWLRCWKCQEFAKMEDCLRDAADRDFCTKCAGEHPGKLFWPVGLIFFDDEQESDDVRSDH